ncbi:MAG: hypothetical protein ACR2NM_17390, partial [Bythopirellula sp.]
WGIRAEKTLNVVSGSAVPDNFVAGPGSVVNITGGAVGVNLEALDAEVNVSGGTIGAISDVFGATTVNMTGGFIGRALDAYHGSIINIHEGAIGEDMRAYGAIVNIHGGSIGEDFKAADRASVVLTDGVVEDNLQIIDSVVNISGGEIGDTLWTISTEAMASRNGAELVSSYTICGRCTSSPIRTTGQASRSTRRGPSHRFPRPCA